MTVVVDNASLPRTAIVLAAGQGTRLLPLTERLPKCLVEVNGTAILRNALAQLARRGVRRARIVVGYLAEVIRAQIPPDYLGMQIELVSNPDYGSTNSMYSLALGLSGVKEDAWVLEGDVYFDGHLLDGPAADGDVVWMIDTHRRDLDGAYVHFDTTGIATHLEIVRNGAAPGAGCGKSVGILRLSRAGVEASLRWLRQGAVEGKQGLYYDLIFAEHFGTYNIHVRDVGGLRWFEIDTPGDLARAEDMFR